MATLKETAEAEIAALEAEKTAIEQKISDAKAQLGGFAAWAEKEIGAAEADIKAFFDKFKSVPAAPVEPAATPEPPAA